MKSSHTTIAGNNIGIEGAQSIGEILKTNTSLTSLDLEGETTEKTREKEKRHKHDQIKSPHTTIKVNDIGVEGAQSIVEALKTNASLTSLNIRGEIIEKTREKEKRHKHDQIISPHTRMTGTQIGVKKTQVIEEIKTRLTFNFVQNKKKKVAFVSGLFLFSGSTFQDLICFPHLIEEIMSALDLF